MIDAADDLLSCADDDLRELRELARLARRRAHDARNLATHRRRTANGALAGRQLAYAQALLDSASWLDAAAEVEERRAAQLDAQRAFLAGRGAAAGTTP
jgi:hypothetical protein